MSIGRKTRRAMLLLSALLLAALAAGIGFSGNPPGYDPGKIARAETRMWQAYYSRSETRLVFHLAGLLRAQLGLSRTDAARIGSAVARSALTFRTRGHASRDDVLPVLEDFYRRVRDATGADFDPGEAARAEMAWWVARRTPGENSPEQVGRRIAELYAILYGKDHPVFHEAGLLRARAAALRDRHGADTDWSRVETLLRESYGRIAEAIGDPRPGAGRRAFTIQP